MVLRGARYRGFGGPGWPTAGRAGLVLAGLVLAIGLAGCSPIQEYRSLTGVARNDPDPETAPFSQNLAAGEAMAYPNLATVPPPPTRATTTAERQKLTQSLIAERTETQSDATKGLPPAPPPTSKPAGSPAAKPTAGTGTQVATVPTAPPAAAAPAAANPAVPTAAANPAPPAAANPAVPTAAASTAPEAAKTANAMPELGHRPAKQPAEPPPRESSLQMPQVSAVPEPEKTRPPLPPPNLPAPPPLAVAPVRPPPETVVAGMPAPPPAVPVIADVPQPTTLKPQAPRPIATFVAALELSGMPPRIDGDGRAQIQRVAALYNEQPRPVRVVAYAAAAAPGAPGGEPLAGYHAALERAQAVAAALRAAGIPADKVQAEASPASGASPTDRVDIQLMP
jgi:hypothetical protein